MLCVAAAINLVVLIRKRDPVFPGVLAWASYAIGKCTNCEDRQGQNVRVTATVVASVGVALSLIAIALRMRDLLRWTWSKADGPGKYDVRCTAGCAPSLYPPTGMRHSVRPACSGQATTRNLRHDSKSNLACLQDRAKGQPSRAKPDPT